MISLTLGNLLIILILLLILEGFFSGSEIALLSLDKINLAHLAKNGNKKAIFTLNLIHHPERILSTTLLMSSLCVIGCSSLTSLYLLHNNIKHAEIYSIYIVSPMVVLIGELIPKTIYQKHANTLGPWVSYPIQWTYWIFFPITHVLGFYTSKVSKIAGSFEELLTGQKRYNREEIESLLSYKRNETEIKSIEEKIIKRILDFRYSQAKHALIPLVQVNAIEKESSIEEALDCFQMHRHTRIPVYSERIDNIIGTLEIMDLLTVTNLQSPIAPYLSSAYYVSETHSLHDLILQMRKEENEMVIVVDEHGGATGILTFEDIVEEIVGEINDEFDYEIPLYEELKLGHFRVQARIEIKEINEILKIKIPEGDYETLSGFLLQQFGRIPKNQDELFYNTETGAYKFTIQKATERHIEIVHINKIE